MLLAYTCMKKYIDVVCNIILCSDGKLFDDIA